MKQPSDWEEMDARRQMPHESDLKTRIREADALSGTRRREKAYRALMLWLANDNAGLLAHIRELDRRLALSQDNAKMGWDAFRKTRDAAAREKYGDRLKGIVHVGEVVDNQTLPQERQGPKLIRAGFGPQKGIMICCDIRWATDHPDQRCTNCPGVVRCDVMTDFIVGQTK